MSSPSVFVDDKAKVNTFNLKVFVVEDNKINRTLLTRILRKIGCEVSEAEDGVEFLESFQPGVYDLVLMDIQMPRLDGLSAVKQLREQGEFKQYVCAVTAHAILGDKEKFLSQGFDNYLSKPVSKETLCEVLRDASSATFSTKSIEY